MLQEIAPTCCPHCGQPPKPKGPLTIEPWSDEVVLEGKRVRLPPVLRKILAALNEGYPGHVTAATLAQAASTSQSSLRVRVHVLRERLREAPIPVKVLTAHGYGYRLEVEGGK